MELVMELASFGTLKELIEKSTKGDGELDVNKWRIKLISDISNGMNYLHSHEPVLLHRDLKSSNIMVCSDKEGNPIAKVLL